MSGQDVRTAGTACSRHIRAPATATERRAGAPGTETGEGSLPENTSGGSCGGKSTSPASPQGTAQDGKEEQGLLRNAPTAPAGPALVQPHQGEGQQVCSGPIEAGQLPELCPHDCSFLIGGRGDREGSLSEDSMKGSDFPAPKIGGNKNSGMWGQEVQKKGGMWTASVEYKRI